MSTDYVAVKNLHHRDYEEDFRGKPLTIPAGGSIKMTRGDANAILRSYVNDEKGSPRVKMLQMEPWAEGAAPVEEKIIHTCMACGKTFPTVELLEEHSATHENKVETTEKTFDCPFCDYKATSERGMRLHFNQKHMG